MTNFKCYRCKSCNPGPTKIGDPGKTNEEFSPRNKDDGKVKLPKLRIPFSVWPRKISVPEIGLKCS